MPGGGRNMLIFSVPPNLSLNADVPHAGLRPGSGPPVSFVR
jgi:hypothetical protein